MTRQEIEALDGPTLGMTVALQIMGWKYSQYAPKGYDCPSGGNNQGWLKPPNRDWICLKCDEGDRWPGYAWDIAAAWDVYEWLAERGTVRVSNGDGDSKNCDFLPFNGQLYNSVGVSATSYPRAICIVALLALKEFTRAGSY